MSAAPLVDVRLPASPESAALARRQVERLPLRMSAERLEDLRLLVSELVTNSIRHARVSGESGIVLRVLARGRTLRTEVVDSGKGFRQAARRLESERIGGWGLILVDQLADRWGVSLDGVTQVWFEIDLGED